jgi:hypothetical protein
MTNRETGYMQTLLTMLYLVGYFLTLHAFIEGRVKTPLEWQDTLKSLLAVLTAGVLSILYFWFNRSRGSAPPGDPQ